MYKTTNNLPRGFGDTWNLASPGPFSESSSIQLKVRNNGPRMSGSNTSVLDLRDAGIMWHCGEL